MRKAVKVNAEKIVASPRHVPAEADRRLRLGSVRRHAVVQACHTPTSHLPDAVLRAADSGSCVGTSTREAFSQVRVGECNGLTSDTDSSVARYWAARAATAEVLLAERNKHAHELRGGIHEEDAKRWVLWQSLFTFTLSDGRSRTNVLRRNSRLRMGQMRRVRGRRSDSGVFSFIQFCCRTNHF